VTSERARVTDSSGGPTYLAAVAARRTVRLTTTGRKTGRPRTVTVWFVAGGPTSIYVQHAGPSTAQWYRNLLRDPAVTVDFGSGPLAARATPLEDPARVSEVLRLVRRKYWLAWIFQLSGRRHRPVAAEIALARGSGSPFGAIHP
jgi:deazaflavin-dependent oxidoreductase (nitroreductase family)